MNRIRITNRVTQTANPTLKQVISYGSSFNLGFTWVALSWFQRSTGPPRHFARGSPQVGAACGDAKKKKIQLVNSEGKSTEFIVILLLIRSGFSSPWDCTESEHVAQIWNMMELWLFDGWDNYLKMILKCEMIVEIEMMVWTWNYSWNFQTLRPECFDASVRSIWRLIVWRKKI